MKRRPRPEGLMCTRCGQDLTRATVTQVVNHINNCPRGPPGSQTKKAPGELSHIYRLFKKIGKH